MCFEISPAIFLPALAPSFIFEEDNHSGHVLESGHSRNLPLPALNPPTPPPFPNQDRIQSALDILRALS